jgi:hypothetical protein
VESGSSLCEADPVGAVARYFLAAAGRSRRRREALKRFKPSLANTLRVERTERLEGSRFVAWQFYGLVSRRLPGTSRGVVVLWAGCNPPHGIDAMGKTLRWVIPGSRPLLTDRAAIL